MRAVGAPLEVVEVPEPEPDDRSAIVRVSACGVCRSDWHLWKGDWSWEHVELVLPRILGHEASGVVESAGRGVTAVAPGQRVCIPFHEACGRCRECLAGRSHICPHADYIGNTHDGAFAELVRVPNADVNCIPLPDEVGEVEAAAMGCRYMTAFHAAAHRGRARAGEWAVVYGCGGLGLSLVQVLEALSLRVVAVDVDDSHLALARELGAEVVVNGSADDPVEATRTATGGGAHLSFDALGSASTSRQCLLSLRARGRHVQVGLTSADDRGSASWPIDRITFRELEVFGSIGNPLPAYPELLALVASRTFRPSELIRRTLSLADVPAELEAMTTYDVAGFSVVTEFAGERAE
jgi:D-arabinose 1-dehydrogenase-like Zn-dependent alcohol dehydrogenase